jgi:large subunit ribosomal protein L23
MEYTDVIRRPLVTEKATLESSEFNRYAFEVDRLARKDQIKKAIEALYGVRVIAVATQNRRGRMRRNRYGFFLAKGMKRAVVRVHPDDRIELF